MYYNDPSQPAHQQPFSGSPYGAGPDDTQQPGPPPQNTPVVPSSPWPSPYPQPAQFVPVAQQGTAKARRSGMRSGAIFLLTIVVLFIFGIGLFSGWTFANAHGSSLTTPPTASTGPATGTNTTLSETTQEAVLAKVEPSVVEIKGVTSDGEAIGSGSIIDSKGDIVTNNHVVDGTSSLEVVLSDGTSLPAQLVGTDPSADVAVVRIQPFANMAVATFGDSSKLTVGEEILAIGNPLGYSETATEGVVSALKRTIAESKTVTLSDLIQISAAINPGNSGGALVNMQGQLVGMPTLSAVDTETNTPANGLGFAISSNQMKIAIAQILQS